jgi:thiamine-monophosphate kinase
VRVPERAAIGLLESLLAARSLAVPVGIGDDAAVVAAQGQRWVWTVDACVEGVHFERRWLSLADVGWRSYQAAVSDVAAMGGQPIAALSSLILPPRMSRRQLQLLGSGQAAAAAEHACPVVGGNIASGDVLSITTTVLGRTPRPLLRSGAKPGQGVYLIGDVGLAAAGLRLLQRPRRPRRALSAQASCLSAWRRPRAQVAAGRGLARVATSAIDVSDGLVGDCQHLAEASGVQIVIEDVALAGVLHSALGPVAELLDTTPRELALVGGEDYALVVTGPSRRRPAWMRRIGRVRSGRGVVLEEADGTTQMLSGGFEHR